RKYLLTVTIRRDGFSGFAENNKIGWFPSMGLGWSLSKEDFLADINVINHLKLRASYGVNGNLTDRYSSLAQLERAPSYVFGGSTVFGQHPVSMGSDELSWETTKAFNIGLEFGLIDNRLSGTLDYYQAMTTDLLWDLALPGITGFSS